MRITAEDHPDTIKRYAHVKRAPSTKGFCAVALPESARTCSLGKSHRGPHVAHGLFGRVVAVWDLGHRARPPAKTARPNSEARARRSLRVRKPIGKLADLRELVTHAIGSVQDAAFLIFFLSFVGFAIYWVLLILT
jgi:hypothetical protein